MALPASRFVFSLAAPILTFGFWMMIAMRSFNTVWPTSTPQVAYCAGLGLFTGKLQDILRACKVNIKPFISPRPTLLNLPAMFRADRVIARMRNATSANRKITPPIFA